MEGRGGLAAAATLFTLLYVCTSINNVRAGKSTRANDVLALVVVVVVVVSSSAGTSLDTSIHTHTCLHACACTCAHVCVFIDTDTSRNVDDDDVNCEEMRACVTPLYLLLLLSHPSSSLRPLSLVFAALSLLPLPPLPAALLKQNK